MGTYVRGEEPNTYKEARAIGDAGYVGVGPCRPKDTPARAECARHGTYTDDTNTTLALASSLVECGQLDGAHAARRYAEFWRDSNPYRGYPDTAKQVMQRILDGVSYTETGVPPYFPFADGSFANGGAMRISPLAVAYRHASPSDLRATVEQAVMSSHRHAEAIDGAVVQAGAVQYMLGLQDASAFDAASMLTDLADRCITTPMSDAIQAVFAGLQHAALDASSGDAEYDHQVLSRILALNPRPGNGMGFQIAAVHMMPCVLWVVCRHGITRPAHALCAAIALGGDTDTTAAMVGAIVGALHGESWVHEAGWYEPLENGAKGRDFALELADALARMDLRTSPR